MSMITASIWVPRGAAAEYPTKYDVDESELSRISKLANLRLEDAKEEQENFERAEKGLPEASQDDDEDSDMEDSGVRLATSKECVDFGMATGSP